mmetsp:Transcript_20196/g.44073  ORF Transcript_20196/g.44073 Transcript_20196/m.44073 type:complete len:215 (-) Transcript_20196:59-703(-)
MKRLERLAPARSLRPPPEALKDRDASLHFQAKHLLLYKDFKQLHRLYVDPERDQVCWSLPSNVLQSTVSTMLHKGPRNISIASPGGCVEASVAAAILDIRVCPRSQELLHGSGISSIGGQDQLPLPLLGPLCGPVTSQVLHHFLHDADNGHALILSLVTPRTQTRMASSQRIHGDAIELLLLHFQEEAAEDFLQLRLPDHRGLLQLHAASADLG